MRSPIKRILEEYRTFIMKMGLDIKLLLESKVMARASGNFDFLVDVEVILSLACIHPLLNVVHSPIKFSQPQDAFICDYFHDMKVCQSELAMKYIDKATTFSKEDYSIYHEPFACKQDALPMG